MSDIECPYCGEEQEVCNDDGFGYEEGVAHEMECGECEKNFTFQTSILFLYEPAKADCLNGLDHNLRPSRTYPKKFTKMRCDDCDYKRKPTDREWFDILENMEAV